MRRLFKEKGLEKKKVTLFGRRAPLILLGVLGGLVAAVVFLAIDSSSKGAVLVELESQAFSLEGEGRELSSQLVSQTSLVEIREQSEALGMVEPEVVLYLQSDEPIARLP